MKSVLISIQPKWVVKIASSKKTIEVRKTRPKIETPFKCYIYQTKKFVPVDITDGVNKYRPFLRKNQGKVIGEFVCDRIDEYNQMEYIAKFNYLGLPDGNLNGYVFFVDDLKEMCLTYNEVSSYGKGKTLYGWHISDLKIYDEPKELSEFTYFQGKDLCCLGCEHVETCQVTKVENCVYAYKPLTRPPQSWCYVEVGE